MKKMLAVALMVLSTGAFAQTTKVTEVDYALPKCAAPVASVMVGKLVCKASGCQKQEDLGNSQLAALARLAGAAQPNFANIGDGLAAMLTTALKETGCFEIQEREALEELNKELALVGKKVEVQQADFMISGAITSVNMNTEKKAIGGGFIPIIGAISTTTNSADIGVDIKIIDVNRAKVLESKTFQANNETTSYGLGGAGWGGGAALIGGMSSIKGTPMEPVVRDVLARVASFSSNKLMLAKTGNEVPAKAMPAQSEAAAATEKEPSTQQQ